MQISKILSSNDIGLTGAHQAGVAVPHQIASLRFFPSLNDSLVNPRMKLVVLVPSTGEELLLNYIYYNGRLHGTSTRNEYRLTGISRFLKQQGAAQGDELAFTKRASGEISLELVPLAQIPLDDDQPIKIAINAWTLRGVKP